MIEICCGRIFYSDLTRKRVWLEHFQVKKKLPKVNRELAARLLAGVGDESVERGDLENLTEGAVKDPRRKELKSTLLKDDRFSEMFKDQVLDSASSLCTLAPCL